MPIASVNYMLFHFDKQLVIGRKLRHWERNTYEIS